MVSLPQQLELLNPEQHHAMDVIRSSNDAARKTSTVNWMRSNVATAHFLGAGTYGVVMSFVDGVTGTTVAFKVTGIKRFEDSSRGEAFIGTYYTSHHWQHGYAGVFVPPLDNRVGQALRTKDSDPAPNLIDYRDVFEFSKGEPDWEELFSVFELAEPEIGDRMAKIKKTSKTILVMVIERAGRTMEDILVDVDLGDALLHVVNMLAQIVPATREYYNNPPKLVHADLSMRNVMLKQMPSNPSEDTRLEFRMEKTREKSTFLVSGKIPGKKTFFPLYMAIDLGFAHSVLISDALNEAWFFDERGEERDVDHWDIPSLAWTETWGAESQGIAASRSFDLHTLGTSLLMQLALRFETLSEKKMAKRINAEGPLAMEIADFAITHLLYDAEALPITSIPVTPRREYDFKPSLVVQVVTSLVSKARTWEELATNLSFGYGELTFDGEVLADIATTDPAKSKDIAPISDMVWFDEAVSGARASSASTNRFWTHAIFSDMLVERSAPTPPAVRSRKRKPETKLAPVRDLPPLERKKSARVAPAAEPDPDVLREQARLQALRIGFVPLVAAVEEVREKTPPTLRPIELPPPRPGALFQPIVPPSQPRAPLSLKATEPPLLF